MTNKQEVKDRWSRETFIPLFLLVISPFRIIGVSFFHQNYVQVAKKGISVQNANLDIL